MIIIAADNLQALNPTVAAALRDLDLQPLKDLGRCCQQAGASLLDLNPGFLACTLEEIKLREILPLAAAHQTPLVFLLLDARSQTPPTLEGKIAMAVELRKRALAAGL